VVENLGGLPALAAVAGLAGALMAQSIGALRLSRIARSQGLRVGGGEALSISLAAVFYGLFLPAGNATGWAVRLLRLSRDDGRFGAALLVLGFDRSFATASLAAIGAAADLALGRPATVAVSVLLVAVALCAMVPAMLLGVPSTRRLLAWTRSARLPRWLGGKIGDLEGLETGTERGTAALATVLSLCLHVVGIAIWVVLARSLGIDVDVVVIAWVRSAAMVVALVPASVGGLGLRESASIYLLGFFGVRQADALSLSLAVFAVTVLAVGFVGGCVELWRLLTSTRSVAPKRSGTPS